MALDWLKHGTRGAGMGLSRLGFDPTGVRRSLNDFSQGFDSLPNLALPDRLGFDPTGVRGSGRDADPTGLLGDFANPLSLRGTSRGAGLTGMLAGKWGFPENDPAGMGAYLAEVNAKLGVGQGTTAGAPMGDPGTMASLGGNWSGVDKWNGEIAAAAAKFGVPGNLIKAVMKLESGGANLGRNGAGAIGPMQVVDRFWGNLGYNLYDPAQNIMAGAYVLKSFYDQWHDAAVRDGQDPWLYAVRAYYAGNPYSTSGDLPSQGGTGMSPSAYGGSVWGDYQALNRMAQGQTGGSGFGMGNPNATGASGSYATIFGGRDYPVTFNYRAGGGPNLYGYGTGYGLNGSEHTGLDVGTPMGTTLYAPMGGTVTCAGTGRGPGAYGSGCAAFNDYMGAGAGRVEVLLDNGTVLIYGHSSTSLVSPGQRVSAGTPVATSGGMNGAHVHLEARVRDTSKGSGWRIIDPRQALGSGSYVPPGSTSPAPGGYAAAPVPMTQTDVMISLMRGIPVPGYG